MTRQASGVIIIAVAFLVLYLIRRGSLQAVLALLRDPNSTTTAAQAAANTQAAEAQVAAQKIEADNSVQSALDAAKIQLLQQQLQAKAAGVTQGGGLAQAGR